ncbi:Asparagine--tRNA ligase [Buchnera aphidicola (Eriosoma lanigerum)]|uniref:asparagine--tRNA ligase n=1 Tax=Buchnera aphidicola TaxID=9 RepID=UPI003463E1B1
MCIVSVLDVYKNKINVNTEIIIRGWMRNKRDSKLGFSFLDIVDGSSVYPIQFIVYNHLLNYQEVLKLTTGCSIIAKGILVYSQGKNQVYEVIAKKIKIYGWIDKPNQYPISSKKHSMEFLRTVPHLRSRTNLISVISRVRHIVMKSLHDFLNENFYYWIPTPIITSLDTEGMGSMFRVSTLNFCSIPKNSDGSTNFNSDFFGKESFLTVSGQLTLESYACSLSKVYTFGPTFRAENSNTSRHLAEFWMLEVEQAFINLNNVINLAESLLKYVVHTVLEYCTDEIKFLMNKVDHKIKEKLETFLITDFIQINYSEAINILLNSKKRFQEQVRFGLNLSSEHEKYLIHYYNYRTVVIKNYPKSLKAFYMRLNDDQITVAAVDILLPGIGEVIGGSEREERIDVLISRLKEYKYKNQDYEWYIDLRRYGTVPHAGFGMGFERFVSYITGVSNVRDLIPFPRTVKNSYC